MNEPDAPLHDEALRHAVQRLGARAAERLDVEATAARVVERLRREPRAAPWTWIRPVWLRIAAAAVVLLGGALLVADRLSPERGTAVAAIPTGAELYGLSASELEELLATLDRTLDLDAPLPGAESGLDELSEDQLRTVLETLEG